MLLTAATLMIFHLLYKIFEKGKKSLALKTTKTPE